MTTIILASASPRRRELLSKLSLPFFVIPSGAEETASENDASPEDLVLDLSMLKASDIAEKIAQKKVSLPEGADPDDILVIGADTIVVRDGTVLGKPIDETDAIHMLSSLQGRNHDVFTGITLIHIRDGRETIRAFAEKTEVRVAPMKPEEIRSYIAEGESLDKAGAYGIQGSFCRFITGINGDYFNVVGLPIAALYQELKKIL